MDSFSIFSQSRGGDVSVLGSLITALTVARSIGANRDAFERAANAKQRQIAFAFFAAESLGYIGSSAAVYNMQKPSETLAYKPERTAKHLTLDDLAAFIELQQMSANHTKMFLHGENYKMAKFMDKVCSRLLPMRACFAFSQMHELKIAAIRGAKRSGGDATPLYQQSNARLPPASFQTFLNARLMPGYVIAPFEKQYETRVLNSFFDTQLSEATAATRESVRAAVLRDVALAGSMALQILADFVGNQSFADTFKLDTQFVRSFGL